MSDFKIYGPENSPILESVQEQLGFVPNVFGVLGDNANALEAFATLNTLFASSSLNPIEREVVQITASMVNSCEYCVSGHTAFSHIQDLDISLISALRAGEALGNVRLEALRLFAQSIVSTKGRDAQAELQNFLAAGYDRQQAFDVVLGINVKMFSNHVAGLAKLQLDEAFERFQWISDDINLSAA